MHASYFDLTSPLDRRIYEIVRKGHGTNKELWRIRLENLQTKTGSKSSAKEFRRMIKQRIEANLIPGYKLEIDGHLMKSHSAPDKVLVVKIQRKPRAKK